MSVALHNTRIFFAVLVASILMAVVPATASADQLRGAQVHSLWASSSLEDSKRELDLLADAGANSVRLDISWSSLETDGKGDLSPWFIEKTDAILAHARSRGLKVVAVFWSSPCWASSAPEDVKQGCAGSWWDREVDRWAPASANDYADAAEWVAKRWGDQLEALEIWNEPNLADQYFLRASDPAAVSAALLKASYPRIKAAAPGLTVLAGVLAGSDGDFLEALYRNGIKGNFDGISVHPYNEWRDPDDAWQDQWKRWSFLRGIPWIHQVMTRAGDGDKGVWLTEFGFSTCGNGDRWCVSSSEQAEYIKDSFRIAARWDYVKAAMVYNLRNKGTNPSGREDQFGMLNRDFSPKPAWNAFREAMGNPTAGEDSSGSDSGSGDSEEDLPAGSVATAAPQVAAPAVTVTTKGIAPVPLKCPRAARRCVGEITVVTKPIRARKGAKKKSVRLGGRAVRIRGGGKKVVKIKIPKRYRPLLKKLRTVRVKVTVTSESTVGVARSRKHGLTLRTRKISTARRSAR